MRTGPLSYHLIYELTDVFLFQHISSCYARPPVNFFRLGITFQERNKSFGKETYRQWQMRSQAPRVSIDPGCYRGKLAVSQRLSNPNMITSFAKWSPLVNRRLSYHYPTGFYFPKNDENH